MAENGVANKHARRRARRAAEAVMSFGPFASVGADEDGEVKSSFLLKTFIVTSELGDFFFFCCPAKEFASHESRINQTTSTGSNCYKGKQFLGCA